jgi:hypothetical protein
MSALLESPFHPDEMARNDTFSLADHMPQKMTRLSIVRREKLGPSANKYLTTQTSQDTASSSTDFQRIPTRNSKPVIVIDR